MSRSVPEEELLQHADRIRGKILLITGAGSGIGKAIAVMFARYGAKIVIGDINAEAANTVAEEIKRAGGSAISLKCNVTVWEDQVALFEAGIKAFGSIDVVVPNAGVTESRFTPLGKSNGKLAPPDLTTIDVNLKGVLYTCSLALHFLIPGGEPAIAPPGSVKALVLIGSMTAWHPIETSVLYSTSKHGVLGLQRAIGALCTHKNIRVGSVHPWFVETGITVNIKGYLTNMPIMPASKIAATVLGIATDTEQDTSERPWLFFPYDENAYRVHAAELSEGLYEEMNAKNKALAAWRLGTPKRARQSSKL